MNLEIYRIKDIKFTILNWEKALREDVTLCCNFDIISITLCSPWTCILGQNQVYLLSGCWWQCKLCSVM